MFTATDDTLKMTRMSEQSPAITPELERSVRLWLSDASVPDESYFRVPLLYGEVASFRQPLADWQNDACAVDYLYFIKRTDTAGRIYAEDQFGRKVWPK